jgi:hypothetical protein
MGSVGACGRRLLGKTNRRDPRIGDGRRDCRDQASGARAAAANDSVEYCELNQDETPPIEAAYRVDHERVRLDPEARNVRHTHVDPSDDRRTWRMQQVLVDPELHNDWMAELAVDLAASREANQPVLWLRGVGPIGYGDARARLGEPTRALTASWPRSTSGVTSPFSSGCDQTEPSRMSSC